MKLHAQAPMASLSWTRWGPGCLGRQGEGTILKASRPPSVKLHAWAPMASLSWTRWGSGCLGRRGESSILKTSRPPSVLGCVQVSILQATWARWGARGEIHVMGGIAPSQISANSLRVLLLETSSQPALL